MQYSKDEFKKIERQAEKKAYRLTHEKPEVEVISAEETYLLRDGHRIKRICGFLDDDWPCLMEAGYGTYHEGRGRCKKHTGDLLAGQTGYVKRLTKELSKESEIRKEIVSSGQANENFYDVDKLLRLLDAFLTKHIKDHQFEWSGRSTAHAVSIIESMRKLIETNLKKEEARFNASVVVFLVKEFVKIVRKNTSIETAEKIEEEVKSIDLPKEIENVEFKIIE